MSEPETCLGCARKVPDDATWKRDHAEECGDACWCRAYCWTDGHCEPNPADIAARARAEAFEECARIAEGWADRQDAAAFDKLREDAPCSATEHEGLARVCRTFAAEIRRRAKP